MAELHAELAALLQPLVLSRSTEETALGSIRRGTSCSLYDHFTAELPGAGSIGTGGLSGSLHGGAPLVPPCAVGPTSIDSVHVG